MKSHRIPGITLLVPLLLSLLLVSCGGLSGGGDTGEAKIRLFNLSTGYKSLDLYTATEDSDSDTQLFTAVTMGSVSSYATMQSDEYALKFRRSGTSGNLHMASATLVEDVQVTYVAHGELNKFAVVGIDDSTDAPSSGYSDLQVLNLATVGALDVYLTGSDDSLDDVSTTVAGLAAGSQTAARVATGTYRLRVTPAGSKTEVKLNVPDITLPNQGVQALILVNTEGGVLVNAVVLPRRGEPTTYTNSGDAQIRVLNTSTGYETLDLYAEAAGTTVTTPTFAGVERGDTTEYAPARADTYSLKFRSSGTSGNLLVTGATLAEDKYYTYVAYGTTNRFAVIPIQEDVTAPDPGYTSIQIVNATSSDSLDVYLTGPDDTLSNVTATVSAVAPGTQTTRMTVRDDAYRLRITGAGSKTDLRLDVPEIVLESEAVVSLVLTDTHGGVLVNAILLPQRGEPIRFDNPNLRLRAVSGLSSGSTVSVTLGTTQVLTRRPARSFFPASYTQFTPGNTPVTVEVDDVVVTTGMLNLESGRDYTLLLWDEAGTMRMTLVSDANHVAEAGRARIRLLHGMSGLGTPVSMSMNYLPVAEFVEVGEASEHTELNPGTGYRLEVIDAQTLGPLLVREDVAMESGGVYTFFVAGGGGSAVAGTLRKDR